MPLSPKIEIEINTRTVKDQTSSFGGGAVLIGSMGGYDKGWLARVQLANGLYLQLFPKYGLVACELNNNGNTNLPLGVPIEDMIRHLFRESEGGVSVRPSTGDSARDRKRLKRTHVVAILEALRALARERHGAWGLSHTER